MPQKQSHTWQFVPDPEVFRILSALSQTESEDYINAAVKAFALSQGAVQVAERGGSDLGPAGQVAAQLERIFGGTCDTIKASAADSADYVLLTESNSQLTVKCSINDAIDILKSLRQPISVQEVWDIMSVLG